MGASRHTQRADGIVRCRYHEICCAWGRVGPTEVSLDASRLKAKSKAIDPLVRTREKDGPLNWMRKDQTEVGAAQGHVSGLVEGRRDETGSGESFAGTT